MIKDPEYLKHFEDRLMRGEAPNYRKASRLFEAMWREGRALGVLPPKDPMEGIETDINLARILNACSRNS